MNRLYTYFIVSALLLSVHISCRKQLNPEPEETSAKHSQAVSEYFRALGFNDSLVVDKGDYYLVEGDIVFPKSYLQSGKRKLNGNTISQYETGYYLDCSITTIKIKIDASVASLESEIMAGIGRWGSIANSRIFFTIDNVQPDITIVNDNLGNQFYGRAYFPVNGQPGSLIKLNVSELNTLDELQIGAVVAHEIGHAIGFRHTDSYNESASGSEFGSLYSRVHIPGTPTGADTQSLMNSGIGGALTNTILSTYDRQAFLYLYSTGNEYEISGPASICTGGNYSISGLPTGATVTWSVSPSWAATISSSGNTATISTNYSGELTVGATLSFGPCPRNAHSKVISAGMPPWNAYLSIYGSINGSYNGYNVPVNESHIVFATGSSTNADHFEWEISPSSAGYVPQTSSGSSIDVYVTNPGPFTIMCRAVSSCGTRTIYGHFYGGPSY